MLRALPVRQMVVLMKLLIMYEICSKNWLKQFIGYQGNPLRYKADIDGISGATISANSITSDIQDVHKYMRLYCG